MLVFYRGLHCPICRGYLRDLERKFDDFIKLGVEMVAVSTDTRERAEQSAREWEIQRLPIAYGLSIDEARAWGLYISAGFKNPEPPLFSEPGLFLVKADGTLYASSIQTMPFARPSFTEILQAIVTITKEDYPARGEA